MPQTRGLLLFFILLLLSFSWFTTSGLWNRTKAISFGSPKKNYSISNIRLNLLKQKASEAKGFISANKYNDQICFLIDMRLPSGQNRFFVMI